MILVEAKLNSAAWISFGAPVAAKRGNNEDYESYENRIWADRANYDDAGNVVVTSGALKNAMSDAAKFLSMKIQGKKNQTWTKHFEAGVFCQESMPLGVKRGGLEKMSFFVPADGKRGSGSRVWKSFPVIRKWEGVAKYCVMDDEITKDIFLKHLECCGMMIGIGRFRPRNNGHYGRFNVTNFSWKPVSL